MAMDQQTQNVYNELLAKYRDRKEGAAAHPEMCAEWARERVRVSREAETMRKKIGDMTKAQSDVRNQCIAMANSLGLEINI